MAEIIEINRPQDTNNDSIEGCEHELDPQFKPVVTLPEVEIKTNEENEEVLVKMRAKLYRFDTTEQPSEWKERGTGELKILRHKENNSVRIVMRRDKTYKVCANHFIVPWMILKPCPGNEKAFIYTVPADFADEQPKRECLALKFANVDSANLFKSKFEEAKEILKSKCSLYNGENPEDDSGNDDSSDHDDDDDDDNDDEVSNQLAQLNMSKDDKTNDKNNENKKD